MLLKKLIKNCPNKLANINVKGLSSDTRKLKKGDLFFAFKGSKKDGNKFINEALKKYGDLSEKYQRKNVIYS